MALDSAAKRAAVPGVARPWMRGQLPSAGKGREWRASVGLAYPVANFQSVIEDVAQSIYIMIRRRRRI